MIYLAHFDFVEDGLGSDESHGYFTCMVEAINIDDALDKFKALLLTLRKEEDVLDEVEEVFLDSCIEIHTVPKAGFLANYVSYQGTRTASISTTIRGATDEHCIAYGLEPDEEGEQEITPFISFGENGGAK